MNNNEVLCSYLSVKTLKLKDALNPEMDMDVQARVGLVVRCTNCCLSNSSAVKKQRSRDLEWGNSRQNMNKSKSLVLHQILTHPSWFQVGAKAATD
ncbi:hypothetical protein Tco_0689518 [Tanacetum coccineum]